MPRRKVIARRDPAPDPRFDSPLVTKFINCLMVSGKRSTAERMFYGAVHLCEQKGGESGISIFKQAVANVKPVLEVKSRRVGGATYQVPVEVRPERRVALAMRWLVSYSRSQRIASAVRRTGRTSTGTWKFAPPTRRLFTSTIGFELASAWLKTSSGSLPPFLEIDSNAP